jgi:hypothetical protein
VTLAALPLPEQSALSYTKKVPLLAAAGRAAEIATALNSPTTARTLAATDARGKRKYRVIRHSYPRAHQPTGTLHFIERMFPTRMSGSAGITPGRVGRRGMTASSGARSSATARRSEPTRRVRRPAGWRTPVGNGWPRPAIPLAPLAILG